MHGIFSFHDIQVNRQPIIYGLIIAFMAVGFGLGDAHAFSGDFADAPGSYVMQLRVVNVEPSEEPALQAAASRADLTVSVKAAVRKSMGR